MPELPEVEVLVRHLAPLLQGEVIRRVEVRRSRVIAPTSERKLKEALEGARFQQLIRRGKYLLFTLTGGKGKTREPLQLVGHLGMTGRMYLLPAKAPWPRHAAVVFQLTRNQFVFEDTRYFGRLTLDTSGVQRLGPEPFAAEFTTQYLATALQRSAQAIKVKLLDQSLVAGVGNIYASEALFRAGISPKLAARRLTSKQVKRLRDAIRQVLSDAIEAGSTLPLDFGSGGKRDGLFYYGRAEGASGFYQERLLVYDRQGRPCMKCRAPIKKLVQAARSTYYCARCQAPGNGVKSVDASGNAL